MRKLINFVIALGIVSGATMFMRGSMEIFSWSAEARLVILLASITLWICIEAVQRAEN